MAPIRHEGYCSSDVDTVSLVHERPASTYLAFFGLYILISCHSWLWDVQVRKVGVTARSFPDEVRESRDGIFHAHVLECAPGTDAKRDPGSTNGRGDGVDDLERETAAILDRTPVLIRARVRDILDELVDEVAMRTMELNTVAARAEDGIARSLGECGDIFFDLCVH